MSETVDVASLEQLRRSAPWRWVCCLNVDCLHRSPPWPHLTERAVNYMLKRAASNAGINPKLSAQWLAMPTPAMQ